MMYKRVSVFVVLCILFAMSTTWGMTAHADAMEAQALEVFEQYKDAVVTVELVVRQRFAFMGMDSESEESRLETTGTVIDEDGLTVVSLSATDPMGMMAGLMGGMLGDDMQMQSEVADVRILSDGITIPAAIVLRDKDHDLAFIRPLTSPDPPLASFDLRQSAQPRLLQPLVTIERMGRVANRVHAVTLTRIKAQVERPRRFYLADTEAIGAPALTLEGQCVGVFVTRMIATRDGGGGSPMSLLSDMQDAVSIILIPAETILEGAVQAPAAEDADEQENTE